VLPNRILQPRYKPNDEENDIMSIEDSMITSSALLTCARRSGRTA